MYSHKLCKRWQKYCLQLTSTLEVTVDQLNNLCVTILSVCVYRSEQSLYLSILSLFFWINSFVSPSMSKPLVLPFQFYSFQTINGNKFLNNTCDGINTKANEIVILKEISVKFWNIRRSKHGKRSWSASTIECLHVVEVTKWERTSIGLKAKLCSNGG